jgi:hypothetical protein
MRAFGVWMGVACWRRRVAVARVRERTDRTVGQTRVNSDPQGVFRMEGDTLHVLGIPPTDRDQDLGYLATWADIGNFRARVEQKWGTNTFVPVHGPAPRQRAALPTSR